MRQVAPQARIDRKFAPVTGRGVIRFVYPVPIDSEFLRYDVAARQCAKRVEAGHRTNGVSKSVDDAYGRVDVLVYHFRPLRCRASERPRLPGLAGAGLRGHSRCPANGRG
jgi:hypothetical protein